MIPKFMRLYTAGVWAGYIDPDERNTYEWRERVGDFGLDDARQALDVYVDMELKRLTLRVVKACRDYRQEAKTGVVNRRTSTLLDETLAELEKFEQDYGVDYTGKSLE